MSQILVVLCLIIIVFFILLLLERKDNVKLRIKLSATEQERDVVLRAHVADKKTLRAAIKRGNNIKLHVLHLSYENKKLRGEND